MQFSWLTDVSEEPTASVIRTNGITLTAVIYLHDRGSSLFCNIGSYLPDYIASVDLWWTTLRVRGRNKEQQDRQYSITQQRRVRVTNFAVEKQAILRILSLCLYYCLRYPTCKAHDPYYIVICCVSGSNIFPHYLRNGMIFGGEKKGIAHKMCIVIFSTTFVWNISHSKKNLARYCKCT